MKRIAAFGLLLLFVFSTSATYATVHHCKGELMDIAILSEVSCEHEALEHHDSKGACCASDYDQEEQQNHHQCCEEEPCNDSEEDDCCQTEELNSTDNLLIKVVETRAEIVSEKLPSFQDFYFENHRILKKTYGVAYNEPFLDRDIPVVIQCFRI